MIERLRGWFSLPWLPIVLGPALLFGPALIAGRALFWGTPLLQFTPWRTFAKRVVAAGHIPLWNPELGMGAPLLANYQSALLYPPNWLLLVLDVAWGQTMLVLLHLVLAGAGMVALARRLEMNPLAQTVAGLAFGLSGYLVTRAGFLSMTAAAAWLPWIVLAVDSLLPRRRAALVSGRAGAAAENGPRSLGLLAAALAMQWLSGHAQLAWYSLLLALAWFLFRAIRQTGLERAAKPAVRLAAAGTLAFMIASAQLLPTLEYLSVSDRSAGLDPEFTMNYSFWPWRLIGLLAPDMFGHPRDGSYWGYGNYWEDAIYIGVLPLLLAIAAVLRRRGPGLRWFLAGTAGLSLLLALGRNTPIFPLLYEYAPSFALFQAPTRWNLLLVFSLSLLAGMGVQDWGVARGRQLYWLRLGTAGAAAMLAAALLAQRFVIGSQATFIPAVARAGGLLLASGGLALLRRQPASAGWRALVTGFVLVDLLYAARGANPTLPARWFQARRTAQVAELRGERLYLPSDVERRVKFEQAFRFDDFQADQDWSLVRDTVLPNTGLLDRLTSANNFDPIRPARYAVWIERLEAASDSRQLLLLQHMGVGWVADARANYRPLEGARRAWIVADARWVQDRAAAVDLVFSDAFDPKFQVVLEGNPAQARQPIVGMISLLEPVAVEIELQAAGELLSLGQRELNRIVAEARSELVNLLDEEPNRFDAQGGAELVSLEDRGPNRVDLQVRTEGGGWLVLADAWYPGWNAYLDGQAVEIYPANALFRAAWVPDGLHELSFRYQPATFRLGLALSGLGVIALALALRR